jgi:hypothetical protein
VQATRIINLLLKEILFSKKNKINKKTLEEAMKI